MVERFWVEIKSRVNYPIKRVIIAMQARDEIDLDSLIHKFCILWYTQRVAHVGTSMAVHSWNAHPIPGPHKGVPADRTCENDQTSKTHCQLFQHLLMQLVSLNNLVDH